MTLERVAARSLGQPMPEIFGRARLAAGRLVAARLQIQARGFRMKSESYPSRLLSFSSRLVAEQRKDQAKMRNIFSFLFVLPLALATTKPTKTRLVTRTTRTFVSSACSQQHGLALESRCPSADNEL